MNKFSLGLYKLVLLPSAIYHSWGIDTRQLALILRAKLTMDDRRPNTFQQTRSGQKKEGISKAAQGAIIGGVGGAVVGAVIGKGGKGAILGGVIGAAGGYILGRKKDKASGRVTTNDTIKTGN